MSPSMLSPVLFWTCQWSTLDNYFGVFFLCEQIQLVWNCFRRLFEIPPQRNGPTLCVVRNSDSMHIRRVCLLYTFTSEWLRAVPNTMDWKGAKLPLSGYNLQANGGSETRYPALKNVITYIHISQAFLKFEKISKLWSFVRKYPAFDWGARKWPPQIFVMAKNHGSYVKLDVPSR